MAGGTNKPVAQQPNDETKSGKITPSEKSGNIIMDNIGLVMGGVAAIAGFAFGGPMIGFLILAAGALLNFGGGLFEKAKEVMPDGMRNALGLQHKPVKYLETKVALDPQVKEKMTATIDGQKYEIQVNKVPMADEITYNLAGSADKKTITLDKPVAVGKFENNTVVIDEAAMRQFIVNPVLEKVRKEGKAAVDATGADMRAVDKSTFLATAENGAAFIVKKTDEGFQLMNFNNEVLAEKKGMSKEALLPGGAIMREVGVAVLGLADDVKATKLTTTPVVPEGMLEESKQKQVISGVSKQTEVGVEKATFTIAGETANYSIDKKDVVTNPDGSTNLKAVTIEREGRVYKHEIKPPVEIGSTVHKGGTNVFTPKDGAMEALLADVVQADDKAIGKYANNLKEIAAPGGKEATGKYLYESDNAVYVIQLNKERNGFAITDLEGNVMSKADKNAAEKTIAGADKETAIKEALHMLKEDMGVSAEPSKRPALKLLANNTTAPQLRDGDQVPSQTQLPSIMPGGVQMRNA